jgi:hypothetical protein
MRILSTLTVFFLILITSILLIIPVGKSAPLAVSNIYIEPTGYEDPSTQEWRGSFWIVTAIANTEENFLFYSFNETETSLYGQNKIGDKTIVPTATIKITITPRQPYWEIPLKAKSYMVYPKTYGAYFDYLNPWYKFNGPDKIHDVFVPQLNVDVLECDIDDVWTLHTPFEIKVEKIGQNSFTKTIQVDTVGGTNIISIANPADNLEKLLIADLGKISTGYGQPSLTKILIINKSIAFEKTDDLLKAIDYTRAIDRKTLTILTQENYAFYWFGGGNYKSEGKYDVLFWPDDGSPAHYCKKLGGSYCSLVEDGDFPGSCRVDTGFMNKDQHVYPIAADIINNNPSTNPPGLSLVNYLRTKIAQPLNLDLWRNGWTITADNKLRIYMPTGAASSLITIKISSELADSVVYQPIVANGKVEQAFGILQKQPKPQ